MQVETLEGLAERSGWSPERLAAAQANASKPRPSNIRTGTALRAALNDRAAIVVDDVVLL